MPGVNPGTQDVRDAQSDGADPADAGEKPGAKKG